MLCSGLRAQPTRDIFTPIEYVCTGFRLILARAQWMHYDTALVKFRTSLYGNKNTLPYTVLDFRAAHGNSMT